MATQRMPGGLYLVLDPLPGAHAVLPKLEAALAGGVDTVQLWNHWGAGQDRAAFVARALELCRARGVPVLVHDDPELLAASGADGIHFDEPTTAPRELREWIRRDALYGVTCGNDLKRVRWAQREGADYVSFCSMYPSPSAGACELVAMETLAAARAQAKLTLYASGGVTPERTPQLLAAGADGVAVVSGILGAPDPEAAARAYARAFGSRAAVPAGDGAPPVRDGAAPARDRIRNRARGDA